MNRFFIIFLVLFIFVSSAYADQEFKFRKNIQYTITYVVGDNTVRILEKVYFRKIWDSEAIEKLPYILPSGEVYMQSKRITYVELLKVAKNGRKESFLIPNKNILEIKMVIATGLDSGESSGDESTESQSGDSKLNMSIK